MDYDTIVKIKEYLQRKGYNKIQVINKLEDFAKEKGLYFSRSHWSWYQTKYDKGIDLHEININGVEGD